MKITKSELKEMIKNALVEESTSGNTVRLAVKNAAETIQEPLETIVNTLDNLCEDLEKYKIDDDIYEEYEEYEADIYNDPLEAFEKLLEQAEKISSELKKYM